MSPASGSATLLQRHTDDILACVHCGFCLPACPTYQLLGDENDSPRGRLYLMLAVAEGRLDPADESFALHIDRCLGCRACEPVCPSGVRYGFLLENARAARSAGGGIGDRLNRFALDLVFTRPRLQALVWLIARMFRATRLPRLIARLGTRAAQPGRFRFANAMLAATAPRGVLNGTNVSRPGPANSVASDGEPQPTLAMLAGCVMSGLFAHINRATERVLEAHGARTIGLPPGMCCGALHAHAGELSGARALARRIIDRFESSGAELLVTNSAGCGAALKEYEDWLAGDSSYAERAHDLSSRVRDVSEWLVDRAPLHRPFAKNATRAAYDAPCHLLHAQRVEEDPIRVLSRLAGLTVEPLAGSDRCCGAAGTYGLSQRRLSHDLLQLKLDRVEAGGFDLLLTGNPGCLMHMGAGAITRGLSLRVGHPIEVLDEAGRNREF